MAARKTAVATKETDTVHEIMPDVSEVPGLETADDTASNDGETVAGENDTDNTTATDDDAGNADVENNDENEENETPGQRLERELNDAPEFDASEVEPEFLESLLKRVLVSVLHIEENQEIVLRNTPSEEGIKHVALTSKDGELQTLRKEWSETTEEIEALTKRLQELTIQENGQWKALYEKAEIINRRSVNNNERKGAELGVLDEQTRFRTRMNMLKSELDLTDPENAEYLRSLEARAGINSLQARKSVTGDNPPSSQNSRERHARIREWAKNNGIKVNERGRVSKETIAAYEKANPGDKE